MVERLRTGKGLPVIVALMTAVTTAMAQPGATDAHSTAGAPSTEATSSYESDFVRQVPGKTFPAEVRGAPTMSMTKEKAVGHKAPKPSHSAPHVGRDPPARAANGRINANGVVRAIDRVNAKIRLTHDPILAKGWPRMTLFFRLKDRALADQVKEGDTVQFELEKLASGYAISALQKTAPNHRSDR